MTWQERDAFLVANDSSLKMQCEFIMQKGGGNGGQKINKTSSTVRLKHHPTGLTVYANQERSQTQNRHIALMKLRFEIATHIRCDITDDFIFHLMPLPSEANHMKLYIWMAHLFDFAACENFDIQRVAFVLGVSTSKLDRIIRKYPAILRTWMEFSQKEQITQLKMRNK